MTYAGSNYAFGYDDDSLLSSAGGFTITRNADSGLPETVSDGTLTQTRGFNGYGEIDNYSNTVNAVNVYDVSLTKDNAGRITQRIEVIGAETITWDYVYDNLGRLEEVKKNSVVVESYEYDGNGNRTLETNTMRGIANKVYGYSNEDHIISSESDLYVFDADGFLVDRVSAAGTTTYDYSLRGELLSVDLTDGRSITYDHDPMGRRIAKKIDGTVVEKYLWQDNTTLLAVYDASDNLVMRFNYADGRLPISMLRGSNTYYMMYDQVGSLRLIADSAGNITRRVDYDSFGNVINDTNPGFTIPFGFAGGLHDRDTGLVRFGARDFDPGIGRWTAKDPVDFAGGDVNLYGYVQNNPVNWIDPEGKFVNFAIGFVAGFGIDAAAQYLFTGEVNWGQALVSGAVGATGVGLGSVISKAIVGNTARSILARTALHGVGGAVLGSGGQVAINKIKGDCWNKNIGRAALLSGTFSALGNNTAEASKFALDNVIVPAVGKSLGLTISNTAPLFSDN